MLRVHNPKLDIEILKICACLIHETSEFSRHEVNHQCLIWRLFGKINGLRLAQSKVRYHNEKTYHIPSAITLLHYSSVKFIKDPKLQGGFFNKEVPDI